MKRTVEIDDTLQDCVDGAIDEVRTALIEYLDANPDTDETPDLGNDLDYSGAIHEIVDGAVPIYTAEIDGLYYLYGDELDTAYSNAGIGDGSEDNRRQVAIYCYIDQAVAEWYHNNAGGVFDEWKEKQTKEVPEVYESSDAPGNWGFIGCESDCYATREDAEEAAIESVQAC